MPAEIQVYRSLEQARGKLAPSAVTIGNFDGVHAGHRELFRRLVELGRLRGLRPSVMSFDPHPAKIVAPERAPKLLSTMEQRIRWMRGSGIEQALVLPFDQDFARLTGEEFVRRVLVETAGARAVLVGENFRFGNRQEGDTAMLARLGERYGYTTEVVPGVSVRGRMVSSTSVRKAIEAGEVSLAARLLGRPYPLEGRVASGHGIGSRQTVPTLNLVTGAEVLPARGVYVTRVWDVDSGRGWPAVTNIGVRPTFDGEGLSIESFVLEGYQDPAPGRIRVDFHLRLREERKFPDAAALKSQILRDARRAADFHRRTRRWVGHCRAEG